MDESGQTSREPRDDAAALKVRYSKKQLSVIRAALLSHKSFASLGEGFGIELTWLGLAEAIEEFTGVLMTAEVLRQFVEGVSKKGAPGRQRTPSSQNLQAIIDYLTHPKVGAMRIEELDETGIDYHAGVRLKEFLRQSFDTEAVNPSESLQGYYEGTIADGDTSISIRLWLDIDPSSKLFLVREERKIVQQKFGTFFRKFMGESARNRHESRIESVGWAIPTPEDNLLFFMKEMPYQRNHYWTRAALTMRFEVKTRNRLPLFQHDYPVEISGVPPPTEDIFTQVLAHLKRNVVVFEGRSASPADPDEDNERG